MANLTPFIGLNATLGLRDNNLAEESNRQSFICT